MATIHEPARDVPVVDEFDVCVIGGSCTGVFAAATAARLGAKVAVVEAQGVLGGTATAGLVCVWHSLFDTTHEMPIIGGLTKEIVDRLDARGAAVMPAPTEHKYITFNPAEMILELDELVREAGVRPFLHARFVAPVYEGGRMTAALIEDKSGRRAIRAKQFIDATGDGDVLVRMGLPMRAVADLQPPTVCSVMRGVGEVKRRNAGFDLTRAVFDQSLPGALPEGFLWYADMIGADDEIMIAGTRVNDADCSDADELTQAEMAGRRQVRQMLDVLRRNFDGGDGVSLANIAHHIGIRETRHAQCLHTLTEEEVLNGVRFPDAIANGSYRVDVHHSEKPGLTFRYLDGTERYARPGAPTEVGRWRDEIDDDPTFYQIPYRSLVPKGAENVLAVGRLADADRGAYGATRVMVNCNQTGEAAGAAAVLAMRADCPVPDIDTNALRDTLSAGGSIVI
jgi:FAD-dependent oxidoreductase family protein